MARTSKPKIRTPLPSRMSRKPRIVRLMLRLPESLHHDLAHAAKVRGASLNTEVIRRLFNSFSIVNQPQVIADALLKGLDDDVAEEVFKRMLRDRATDEEADRLREEEQERQDRTKNEGESK